MFHINRIKEKNYMILSYVEKNCDKTHVYRRMFCPYLILTTV